MKLVKVRIRRGDHTKGENQMVYPAAYDAREVDRHKTGKLDYSGHMRFGQAEEWMIVCLEDTVADKYALDPDMEIVDDATADADSEAWRQMRGEPEEQVRDPNRIQAIVAKQTAGIPLTQEDQDALDPSKDVAGINRREKPSEVRSKAETVRGERA